MNHESQKINILVRGFEKPMKIVHVVDSMEVGGAETLVAQMCHLQRQRGHDPRVYAIGPLGALGEQLQKDGFIVKANMGIHLLDTARNFYHIFKETRPDVVHLHNPTPTIYAAIAAKMAGVPRVISTRHSLVAPPRKVVAELKYAVAARFCDCIVGICDATVSNVKSMHSIPTRKILRIYNGVTSLHRVVKEQCPQKNGFTLLYVGRLAPVKNHPLLLSAFQQALLSQPGLRLWMVGDGSERKALEALSSELGISAQVTFWGQQMDVAPFFSAADTFVMSSVSEGLPMSLLQAFSLSIPAIVTDVGGMAEVVRLANAGLTVSPKDPAEMTTAMLHLASNDKERLCFSKNAIESFHSHFTLETMLGAYMELYQSPE